MSQDVHIHVKNRFFLNHRKTSALLISVFIHAVFITVAIVFVAVTVFVKPEQTFDIKDVKRPRMKLRKLQVPVKDQKKTQAPKLRQNIVTKPNINVEVKLPEIVGVLGGTYGSGEGLGGLGFGFDMDLFGGGRGTGNEFIGTFYDLKQTAEGSLSEIGELAAGGNAYGPFFELIEGFLTSNWNEKRLQKYFAAPKQKYATAFMIPEIQAEEAPRAFDVEDQVQPRYWVAYYKGEIAAPETGRYRFWGFGDDVLAVRIGKRLVLNGSMAWCAKAVSDWESDDERSGRFHIGGHSNYYIVIGDWFNLRKGQRVNMDVLIGEVPGRQFGQYLLIEQEGKDYKKVQTDIGLRPVLPIFKMDQLPPELVQQMKIDPNQATVEGPVFGPGINAPKQGLL